MAINTVTITLDGQTITIPLDSASGKYKKTITAPSKTSFPLADNVYPMVLKVSDKAGNVTTVDKNHATFGNAMKLRVLEKVPPTINITSPSSGAFLTSNTISVSVDITDTGSGVKSDTIVVKLDGTTLNVTKTAVTNGFRCTYSGNAADGKHTLSVDAKDNDGNAAATKSVSFTVDTVPPTLSITSPPDILVTNKQACIVSGVTNDATSGIATVKITLKGVDQGTVTVGADGTFSKSVTLVEGENIITITAIDKAGKSTSVTRQPVYDSKAPVVIAVESVPNPVDESAPFVITVEATD